MKNRICCVLGCVAFLLYTGSLFAQAGAKLYAETCASCHNGANERAPARDALRQMTADRVLAAMETGPMISMATRRNTAERRAIAEFVSGKSFGQPLDMMPPAKAMCCSAAAGFTNPLAGPAWNGWGLNTSNTRFQDAAAAGMTAADVP